MEFEHLVGRVVQFSYLEGSKRAREYSGCFVDTTKESVNSISVLANYYYGVSELSSDSCISFKPLVGRYSIGYLPMIYYKYTIDSSGLRERDDCAFSVPVTDISAGDPDWADNLTYHEDLSDSEDDE